jgi:hypothetical protein
MDDSYTKAVLTIIAVALAFLAFQQAVGTAQSQMACGTQDNPCHFTQLCKRYGTWMTCDEFVRH